MTLSAWLVTIPQWLSALLVIGFFVLFGIGLILIVRRLVHHSVLKPHNDIAGFVFATVGVIYAVLIAFVVLNVWETYNSGTEVTRQESSAAFDLYNSLKLYPKRADADKTIESLRVFTLSVVHDEFPDIKAMKWDSKFQPSLSTQKASGQLKAGISQIVPNNLHEQSLLQEMLKDVEDIMHNRSKRLLIAQDDLPGVIWAVVVLGGLITVGFVALFGHENLRAHIILAVLLAITTGSVIYVITSLNFPFSGEVCIGPEGYEHLIDAAGWGKAMH